MKKMKLAFALAVVLLTGGAVFAQTAEDVQEKFNEAAKLLNEKKFSEAVPLFEEVIRMGETVPDATESVENAQKYLPLAAFNAGMTAAQASKFDEAVGFFNKAIEVGALYDPSTEMKAVKMAANVYMVQGNASFNEKAYAKALDFFEKGYQIDPANTKLLLNMARSYAELGQLDNAAEKYQSLIDLGLTHSKFKEDAEVAKKELEGLMLAAASAAAQAKNMADVNKYVDYVVASNPENAVAPLLRIQAAINVKDYDTVIQYGEAAAQVQTDAAAKSNIYFFMGSAYENKGNKAKAVEAYKKVTGGPNAAAAAAQAKALAQ